MNRLAWELKDLGPDWIAEAEELAREATSLARGAFGEEDPLTHMIADTLAVVLHRRGKNDEAIVEFEKLALAAIATAGDDHWFTAMSAVPYGRCLLELGRYEDAEEVLLAVHDSGDESALEALADLYDAWGRPEKAAEYR